MKHLKEKENPFIVKVVKENFAKNAFKHILFH
jgi:hypothetical protein